MGNGLWHVIVVKVPDTAHAFVISGSGFTIREFGVRLKISQAQNTKMGLTHVGNSFWTSGLQNGVLLGTYRCLRITYKNFLMVPIQASANSLVACNYMPTLRS